MSNRIIQLVLWRDVLLALTEQGEIYRLMPTRPLPEGWPSTPATPNGLEATLFFPGLPKS